MNLHRLLRARAAEGRPITVGLIGAGKFGSMFLASAQRMTGLQVAGIAERVRTSPRNARVGVMDSA